MSFLILIFRLLITQFIVLPSEDDKIKVVIVYESYETLTEEKTDKTNFPLQLSLNGLKVFSMGFSMFNLSDLFFIRKNRLYLFTRLSLMI